jgi:hypothetical protein
MRPQNEDTRTYLKPHGTFVARDNGLRIAENKPLHAVCAAIAQAYEGNDHGEYELPSYWASKPRTVLNIIHADILPEG